MGLLNLFKEKPEVKQKRERQEKKQREKQEIDASLAKVRFFPGSQAEYEACVGHQVRIVDLGFQDMGVMFGMTNEDSNYVLFGDFNFKKNLVEQGTEAIINCNYSLGGNNLRYYHRIYGLPVAKK